MQYMRESPEPSLESMTSTHTDIHLFSFLFLMENTGKKSEIRFHLEFESMMCSVVSVALKLKCRCRLQGQDKSSDRHWCILVSCCHHMSLYGSWYQYVHMWSLAMKSENERDQVKRPEVHVTSLALGATVNAPLYVCSRGWIRLRAFYLFSFSQNINTHVQTQANKNLIVCSKKSVDAMFEQVMVLSSSLHLSTPEIQRLFWRSFYEPLWGLIILKSTFS